MEHTFPRDNAFVKNFVVFVLFVCLFFQVTALKFIWNLETLSRLLNATVLGLAIVVFIITIPYLRATRAVFLGFIVPGFLVFCGILVNVSRLIIDDLSNLTYLGFLLPWCIFLAIPTLSRMQPYLDKYAWRIYYQFMLVTTFLSTFEFLRVTGGAQGSLVEKLTSGGWFLAGWFNLFFKTESGRIEERMYGIFLEPGTLGMFLIPAIVWAFLSKRYIGCLVLLVGFYFAGSLGALASLLMVPLMYAFVRKKGLFSLGTFMLVAMVVVGTVKFDSIVERIESKGDSKTTRVENLVSGFYEIPQMLTEDPLGMDLSADLEYDPQGKSESTSQMFATVPIFYQYIVGGVLALVGYSIIVFSSVVSVVKMNRNRCLTTEDLTVLISVVPMFAFVFQRISLWDSALFAILFLPGLCRLYTPSNKIGTNASVLN